MQCNAQESTYAGACNAMHRKVHMQGLARACNAMQCKGNYIYYK